MLGAMGLLGALVAGLSLPHVFGREEDDGENRYDDASSDTADTEPDEDGESPLSVALVPDADNEPSEGGYDAPFGDDEDVDLEDFEDGFLEDAEALAAETGEEQPDPDEATPHLAQTPIDPDFADPDPEEVDQIAPGPDGSDTVDAEPGRDLGGTTGSDVLEGGSGNDTLFGDFGDDALEGGGGDDVLSDGAGDDTLIGGTGNDTLNAITADGEWAFDGQDVLSGGAGDDVLALSGGDVASGGDGADVFAFGPGFAPGQGDAASGPPLIEDFDSSEDALVVVWDDYFSDTPPELSLATNPADPDVLELHGNGKVLALIRASTDVPLDEIALRPVSSLQNIGELS